MGLARLLPVLALVAALAAAFALRAAPVDGYRPIAPGEPWLVDDPDAAYHLRRVSIALGSGRVPGFDRYLDHPSGSPVPWPPFASALFARIAGVAVDPGAGGAGASALGGRSEAAVEAVLVWTPVWLGVLATLAVAGATLALAEGAGRGWAAALAAWIYAVLPSAVWYGSVTHLDHHVLVALLLALHVALVTWSVRAQERVDGILGALAAGIVVGAAIASWLASGLFALAAGIAFFARVLDTDRTRAADGVRAGLLYFASAAVVVSVPAMRSAWNLTQPGSLINLTEGVPRALLCAAVPFAAAGLVLRTNRGVVLRVLAGVVALAAAVVALPGFVAGVREGFAWASRENLFMDVVGESRPLATAGEIASKLSYVAFALPLAVVGLAPGALRRPERLHLLVLVVGFAILTLQQQRFGNSLAVPFACAIALALQRLATRGPRPRRASVALGVGVLLALAPSAASVFETTADEYDDLRGWRSELVSGLRWMRDGTPSPGPWNAPENPQDYGVLASWGLGHLIEYHARRPTIATNFGSFVGESSFREHASALLAPTPEALAAHLHRLGARYVVVRARDVSDLTSTARIAGEDPATLFERVGGRKVLGARAQRSALWRLALHRAEVRSEPYPGLELVYASRRRETPSGARRGEPSGPVVSIYRRLGANDEATVPSLRPAGE